VRNPQHTAIYISTRFASVYDFHFDVAGSPRSPAQIPSSTIDKVRPDGRTAEILKSLRDARKQAVKLARMHRVPVVFLKAGKLVRERP